MVSQTQLTLLQFVALALPAVGIYMQIIHSSAIEKASSGGLKGVSKVDLGHDYQLARSSFLLLALSGLLLIVDLLLEIVFEFQLFHTLMMSAALVGIGFGLFSLIGSGLIQKDALDSDVSIKRAWGSVFDRIPVIQSLKKKF